MSGERPGLLLQLPGRPKDPGRKYRFRHDGGNVPSLSGKSRGPPDGVELRLFGVGMVLHDRLLPRGNAQAKTRNQEEHRHQGQHLCKPAAGAAKRAAPVRWLAGLHNNR